MNLRHKVLLTLAAAFLVIIIILSAVSSLYILSSYETLESVHTAKDVDLVRGNLESRLAGIALLAKDWGAWDDTYHYAAGNNPGFVEANLAPGMIPNLQLNLIVITDNKGNLLYGTGYDLEAGSPAPVPPEILEELADPTSPMRGTADDGASAGFLSVSGRTMLVAAHPILRSDNSGPSAGMIIMGRYADDAMLRTIGASGRSAVSITPVGDLSLPVETGTKLVPSGTGGSGSEPWGIRREGHDSPVLVVPRNDTVVEGRTLLEDIRGQERMLLSIQIPRDIYQQGRSTILTFFLFLANGALIVGIVVIWLIDSLLLSRLDALKKDVESLGRRGDLASRLTTKGDDEIGFLTTALNTTLDRLEHAQKDLQQSETSYRTLIETTPASIAQTDLSGTIRFANRQMAVTHGYDNLEEIQGRFLFDFIASEDRDRAMKNFSRALREGQKKNIEYHGVRRDGSYFWLEMSISVLKNIQGEPESFIVVSRDISRRRIWETRLRQSEERYRAVFENTGTATVILEESTIISLANSEFSRLSGYSRDEIEGKMRWTEFVVPGDLDRMLEQHRLRRMDEADAIKKYEFRFITRSGDIRNILLSVDIIPGTTLSVASLMDFTERKQAETAIQESETKLNTIIDSSPIPQFVIDRNHIVIHWNRALEDLSGIPAAAVLGTDRHWAAFYDEKRPCVADLIVDGIIEKVPEYYSRKFVLSKLMQDQYEVTDFFPHIHGSGKWLYFTSTSIRDNHGAVIGAIETLVDITEQKKGEEEIRRANEQLTAALKELQETEAMLKGNIRELEDAKRSLQKSEARYRDIATNIPGIVFQFMVQGTDQYTVPFISERVFRMFTLGPDEIYSNPNALFNLIHDEDVASARSSLLESARTRDPWNAEFRMKPRGTGETRWFNGRAVPHVLENGDVIWDGVLIDITERKQAEEALVASEHKFHAIFDQTFQFMGLMTPDGTLIQANRAALAFIGKEENDVIGQPFWETPWWTHSKELQDQLYDAVQHVAKGEFRRFEVTHRGSDGTVHTVDFSLKPVKDEDGSVIFLIPEGRDITERKVLQEEVGTALKEKELLLKEIHHRVKNNIQVIASLLNMQVRTVDDPAIKEVLREAQNRVKSIALVHEKLYQSKSLDRIDYHDYLQKISRHLYESYGVSPRNVAMNIHADNISLHIDKAVPCSLIINELLSNAFKHAFPDGRTGDIWIDIHKNGTDLVVKYRDNGIGLPEHISIEESESLGMRLLFGLTRQLHGTIEISRLNGTRITITFPFESGTEAAA